MWGGTAPGLLNDGLVKEKEMGLRTALLKDSRVSVMEDSRPQIAQVRNGGWCVACRTSRHQGLEILSVTLSKFCMPSLRRLNPHTLGSDVRLRLKDGHKCVRVA